MGIVDWMVFPLADIGSEGLTVVLLFGVVRAAIAFYKVCEPGVGTGRVIWWIGKSEDVFVLAYGETLDLSKFGVLEFFRQFLQKVFAAFVVGGESHAEALYRARRDGGGRQANVHLFKH
ncbi:MAG: hypothetical protein ABIH23_00975 [bacterium]